MSEKQIAILLAVYEPDLLRLRELLRSLNRQTRKNLRLYVLDDASPSVPHGDIRRCLEDCVTAFPWELAQNEENLCSDRTFEALTARAEGDCFAYCDQDDVWEPEKLTVLAELLEGENALLAYSDMSVIDELGIQRAGSLRGVYRRREFLRGEKLGKQFLLRNCISGCSMLVRADAARAALPFVKHMYHDHWLALYCAAEGRIAFCPNSLVRYRVHKGNQTGPLRGIETKDDYLRRLENDLLRLDELLPRLKAHPELQEQCVEAMQWLMARRARWLGNGSAAPVLKEMKRNPATACFELLLAPLPEPVFRAGAELVRRLGL